MWETIDRLRAVFSCAKFQDFSVDLLGRCSYNLFIMSNVVQIGAKAYRFISMHGKQFINRREFSCVRDDDSGTVKISDTIPIESQLAQAAKSAVSILEEQRRAHVMGRVARELPGGIPVIDLPRNASPLP